jgi:hypothetical protein
MQLSRLAMRVLSLCGPRPIQLGTLHSYLLCTDSYRFAVRTITLCPIRRRLREALAMEFAAGLDRQKNVNGFSSVLPFAARMAIGACLSVFLSACYSPNQHMFERNVGKLVQVGMPVSMAMDRLSSRGFACNGNHPITCARLRQRLLPSSCVERVNLQPDDQESVLNRVDVPPIVCAGL